MAGQPYSAQAERRWCGFFEKLYFAIAFSLAPLKFEYYYFNPFMDKAEKWPNIL